MPKQVDHDARRLALSRTAAGIVAARGLEALTFRELAAQAGVSVAQVQHYFGTKATLLVHTLNIQSAAVGAAVGSRLAQLEPGASPHARVLAVAEAFLPTDQASRDAMVVYLAFGAGALTDDSLRGAEAFARGEDLLGFLAAELDGARAEGDGLPEPQVAARAVLALILGGSLLALLPGGSPKHSLRAIEHYLTSLGLAPT